MYELAAAKAKAEAEQAAARRGRAGDVGADGGKGRLPGEMNDGPRRADAAAGAGPNAPPGGPSIANMMRRRLRAMAGPAHKDGSEEGRMRGGQPCHGGCSNSDKAGARGAGIPGARGAGMSPKPPSLRHGELGPGADRACGAGM